MPRWPGPWPRPSTAGGRRAVRIPPSPRRPPACISSAASVVSQKSRVTPRAPPRPVRKERGGRDLKWSPPTSVSRSRPPPGAAPPAEPWRLTKAAGRDAAFPGLNPAPGGVGEGSCAAVSSNLRTARGFGREPAPRAPRRPPGGEEGEPGRAAHRRCGGGSAFPAGDWQRGPARRNLGCGPCPRCKALDRPGLECSGLLTHHTSASPGKFRATAARHFVVWQGATRSRPHRVGDEEGRRRSRAGRGFGRAATRRRKGRGGGRRSTTGASPGWINT